MKKILFAFAFLGLGLQSCDPMADINEGVEEFLDKENQESEFRQARLTAPEAYTLTDEDYELSSDEDIAQYKNFSDSKLPKDYLPEILYHKFYGEDAQSMMVTYAFYKRVEADMDNAYELTDADYDEMGQGYGNFSSEDDAEFMIAKLLDKKYYYSPVEAQTEETVLYTLFQTNETRYIKVNEDFSTEVLDYADESYALDSADYATLGEDRFYNFYNVATAEEKVAELAQMEGYGAQVYACDVYLNYFDEHITFRFDGMNWAKAESVSMVSEELNFSLDGEEISASYWWADPAIKITLGAADYAMFSETSTYSNFDLRSGKAPGTDEAALINFVGQMLDENHAPVEDQQYLVTYAYYDGSSGSATIRLIKSGGTWSKVELEG